MKQVMHGCECKDCLPGYCEGKTAPVAFTVVRDGKLLFVCSRCDLPTDKDKVLMVTEETPIREFEEYDPLFVLILALGMVRKMPPTDPQDRKSVV